MKPVDPLAAASNRREFLKTSAAAAGAMTMAGAAGARPVMRDPDEVLQIAVIGTGGMGGGHMRALVGHNAAGREKVQVVALSDVCKPRLEGNAKWLRENQADVEVREYRDYTELLREEKDVDAVWIASPEHWHSQQAIDAVRAGKDVYLEKPMTLDLDQAMDLWREELGTDRIIQVGTQYCTERKYHEARRLIAADAIGHPVTSQTSYCRNSKNGEWLYGIDDKVQPGEMLDWDGWLGPLGPAAWDTKVYHRWRRYRRYSTGIVGDLLVHKMTPLLMALDAGWPVRVTATGGHYIDKAMENHDQVNLTIQFEKEHTMIVTGSTCNEQGLEDMIRGHKGNLYLSGNRCVLRPERIFHDEIDAEDIQYQPELSNPQHQHQLDFLQCVRTRSRPTSTVELGAQVMAIVDLAARSMWEGGAWGFSPASMTAYQV